MKILLKSVILFSCTFLLACTTGNTSPLLVADAAGIRTLEPCPETPNCVSSMEPMDRKSYIPPIGYSGERGPAYQKLVLLVESDPRVRIVVTQANYLRVEYRSAVFRFVDDVEFFFPPNRAEIEVRSASRLGYYDFGKNRRRVEDIRRRWDKGLTH